MMEPLHLHYEVDGSDFTLAGETSSKVKKMLSKLGFAPETIRRTAIAMYEGEINMVIHANGGYIDVDILPDRVICILQDTGPGIPDVEKAMQEGFSTASNQVRELGFGAGMGLPNMKKYADDMKIDTILGQGTCVTLTILTNH